MLSFGVAALAATVALYPVLHTVMLAPPKFGTHGLFDGFLCGKIVMPKTIVKVGEGKIPKCRQRMTV